MKIPPAGKPKSKDVRITIDDFKGGSNSLVEEARMDPKFAKESVNLMQVQDGLWKTRWGTRYYGATLPFNCDGATEYVCDDGTTELIAVAGGHVWKSTDGGSWTEID